MCVCYTDNAPAPTFVGGYVVVARTAADADVAEQLERHHDDSAGGVVDPAAEEQVREHERGVEVPDAAPQERLAEEQQEAHGIVVDQQQEAITGTTA